MHWQAITYSNAATYAMRGLKILICRLIINIDCTFKLLERRHIQCLHITLHIRRASSLGIGFASLYGVK